jgi:hypothetical protein
MEPNDKSDVVASQDKQFPGVELAYPIAVQSYEVGAKRVEIMDGRLQTLLTFIVGVSALVVLGAGRQWDFRSPWFYIFMGLLLAAMTVGVYARLAGKIRILKPNELFIGWLDKPDWEFKKDFIYFAGNDLNHNISLSEKKWQLMLTVTGLFFLEMVFAVLWLAVHF